LVRQWISRADTILFQKTYPNQAQQIQFCFISNGSPMDKPQPNQTGWYANTRVSYGPISRKQKGTSGLKCEEKCPTRREHVVSVGRKKVDPSHFVGYRPRVRLHNPVRTVEKQIRSRVRTVFEDDYTTRTEGNNKGTTPISMTRGPQNFHTARLIPNCPN
jgi:hypothetical protein